MKQVALGESTSYHVSALGAHTKIRFAGLLTPLGIHPQHVGVLRRIADHEGRTQQDIADAMRVRRSVMVGLVDDLEQAGHIERRRHPYDRRANALHLTATGRRTLARAHRCADALDAEILTPLTPTEQDQFVDLLRRVSHHAGLDDGVYPTGPPVDAQSPLRT